MRQKFARAALFLVPIVLPLPYALFWLALRFYPLLPDWGKAVVLRMTGVQESLIPNASVLALLFFGISAALFLGAMASVFQLRIVKSMSKLTDIVASMSDVVLDAIELGKMTDATAVRAIRRKVEEGLTEKIHETETRLRSEWRFVVGLTITILLGAFAVFAAIPALLKP